MYNNFSPFPTLVGERLILKQLGHEHARAIFNYQSNKDNFPYAEMKVYHQLSQAHEYIDKMTSGVKSNEWIILAICLKESEEIVGTVSIWNLNHEEKKAEFGYGIFPKYRKQGFMREALGLAIDYGLEVMELDSIEAYTFHKNIESIQLLKKMNFEYIKTFEDEYCNGALMDLYVIRVKA